MNALEMLGALVWVMVGFALMVAASTIVLVGVSRSWQTRCGKMLVTQAIVPAIVMVLTALFLTQPTMELSWQSLHGPRAVPIWPY